MRVLVEASRQMKSFRRMFVPGAEGDEEGEVGKADVGVRRADVASRKKGTKSTLSFSLHRCCIRTEPEEVRYRFV